MALPIAFGVTPILARAYEGFDSVKASIGSTTNPLPENAEGFVASEER